MIVLRCSKCGQEMASEVDIEEGQGVRCPYCGEKSIYHCGKQAAAKKQYQEPFGNAFHKPQLPKSAMKQPNMNNENGSPRKQSGALIVVVVLVVIVAVAGLFFLHGYRSNDLNAVNSTENSSGKQTQSVAQDNDAEKEKQQFEQERAKRIEEEKAERERRKAEKAKRDAERDQERQEMLQKAEAEKKSRELFERIEQGFRNVNLVFAADFPEKDRLISSGCEGIVYVVGSTYLADRKLNEFTFKRGKPIAVRAISSSGIKLMENAEKVYNDIAKSKFLAKTEDGVVWLYGTGKSSWNTKISLTKPIKPCEEELGGFDAVLNALGVVSRQKFRITIKNDNGRSNPNISDIIGYYDEIPQDKLKDFVNKRISVVRGEKANIKPPKLKKFVPNVIFYDGDIVRGEMNRTLVPRKFKHLGTKHDGGVRTDTLERARNRWEKLKEEAERQEQRVEEVQQENKRLMEEYEANVKKIVSKPITMEEMEQEAGKYSILIERSRSKLPKEKQVAEE